jgi:hypothetical protein
MNQSQNALVCDGSSQPGQKPLMVNFVKELRQVDAHNVVATFNQVLLGLSDSGPGPTVRAETMTAWMEIGFEDRRQNLMHCLLNPAVDAIWNSQIS